MAVILLSLIICIIAVFVLLNAKPNLFVFHLIENIFAENDVRKD